MLGHRLAVATAALLLVAPGVRAAEPAVAASTAPPSAPASDPGPSFGDRFFRGTSPGELPTEKVALVAALYVGAAASIGGGIFTLVAAGSKHDDAESFKLSQPRGFCSDLAGAACASYRRLLGEERSRRDTGYLLLGLGGVLALGGGITAQLWHNDAAPRVAIGVGPGALSFGVRGDF